VAGGITAPPQTPPKKTNKKQQKFGQILGKIKNIRVDVSENMLNSGYNFS
jgi:hypothetical protein